MLPRFGYSNMMGMDMPMGQSPHLSMLAGHGMPPYSSGGGFPLANVDYAAVLEGCHARAQVAEAQVGKLMQQMMEMNQQNQATGVVPPGFAPSHLASEEKSPQRALHQTRSARREHPQRDVEGSPVSGGGKIQHWDQEQRRLTRKLRPKQTLRGFLEELRSEDPRCIFIVRRINKLGFRSKSLLESHYSKFGKVLQVCVAHSKVKPLPNSGQTARTRPGNFGLVVMQDPEAVQKALEQGPVHQIEGIEVCVQKYQPSGLEDEEDDKFDVESEVAVSRRAGEVQTKESETRFTNGGSTNTTASSEGSSSRSGRGINSGEDAWNRQESGSSNSSGATMGSCDKASAGKSLSNTRSHSTVDEATETNDETFLVRLSALQLQELQSMLQRPLPIPKPLTHGDLGEILKKLQSLLEQSVPGQHFSTDSILQAAALIAAAKQQLALMHADCSARMAELTASLAPQAPLDLRQIPGHGLIPDVSMQAMAILQAQHQLAMMQAQLGAGAGPADPTMPMTVPQAAAHLHEEEDAEEPHELQIDTLQNYLKELKGEDSSCMFVVRRVNRLGLKSEEVLYQTYAKFGRVKKVLVTKGKSQRRPPRSRVASLGVVVMDSPASVKKILSQGEEQLVGGQVLKVQGFEKSKARPVPFKAAPSEQRGSSSSGSGSCEKQPKGGSSGYDMEGEGSSSGSGLESHTPDRAGGPWFM